MNNIVRKKIEKTLNNKYIFKSDVYLINRPA